LQQHDALAVAQHAPSGQQSPPGQHDALAVALQAPSRQQSPPGQHDRAVAQQAPSGQHSPPGQQDSLAVTQQTPSGQQSPPGQHAFASDATGFDELEKAQARPATVSISATAQASRILVRIRSSLNGLSGLESEPCQFTQTERRRVRLSAQCMA